MFQMFIDNRKLDFGTKILEFFMQREQLKLQQDEAALKKKTFDLQQQEMERDNRLETERDRGRADMLGLLIQANPDLIGGLAPGGELPKSITGSAAGGAAALPAVQAELARAGTQENEARRIDIAEGGLALQGRGLDETIRHNKVLEAQDSRRIDIQGRVAKLQERGLALNEREFEFEQQKTAELFVGERNKQMADLAEVYGPEVASLQTWGTTTPPSSQEASAQMRRILSLDPAIAAQALTPTMASTGHNLGVMPAIISSVEKYFERFDETGKIDAQGDPLSNDEIAYEILKGIENSQLSDAEKEQQMGRAKVWLAGTFNDPTLFHRTLGGPVAGTEGAGRRVLQRMMSGSTGRVERAEQAKQQRQSNRPAGSTGSVNISYITDIFDGESESQAIHDYNRVMAPPTKFIKSVIAETRKAAAKGNTPQRRTPAQTLSEQQR